MTLHLKDRAIEQKLNELSNGEFSKILNETDMKNPNCICFTIDKKEDIELSVFIRPEAIEPEYNPKAWNEYPKVTPPEDVIMRVELRRSDEGLKAFWDGENWRRCRSTGICWNPVIEKDISRFRPWDD